MHLAMTKNLLFSALGGQIYSVWSEGWKIDTDIQGGEFSEEK